MTETAERDGSSAVGDSSLLSARTAAVYEVYAVRSLRSLRSLRSPEALNTHTQARTPYGSTKNEDRVHLSFNIFLCF